MEYICDAPGDRTWFRLVGEGESVMESELMRHAVENYFRREWEKASESFRPLTSVYIEQDIGKAAHIQREMPLFLTLRNDEGAPLVTAMLQPDPYKQHADAIEALAEHFDVPLDRAHCYPYRRE